MASEKDFKSVGTATFEADLAEIDPTIHELIQLEDERQQRRLIMIPSESICHPVVRRTMESSYTNLYAEGYPSSLTEHMDERQLSDLPLQLAIYRRYADRRFYKGTDYIDVVESLCKRRAAEAFANERVSADNIFANVQALSGAAANLAVQEAFLNPGDTMMALDLMHGGHLSHGSEFHMSGRKYRIVPYGISPKTGLIDYDDIEALALKEQPKLIIAGFTSYPWAPDWARFREIADKVGALLMADIAHPAGMVVAGAYPSPIGYADVVTMTTHKSLMGPRGALILTTDRDKANMVDMAVFPGEQGGPHINTITALAVALKLAKTEEFTRLQHKIVSNAKHFAAALEKAGLALAYGGTDTHLLLVDLKKLPKVTDETLSGEIAVRLLELCGVVCNKNTIPGDTLTAMASGVRMGTVWLTQRGANEGHFTRLADAIGKLLKGVHPYHYDGLMGTLPRGKVDLNLLETVKGDIAQLADDLAGEPQQYSGYPHYHVTTPCEIEDEPGLLTDATDVAGKSAAMFKLPCGMIRVTGERAEPHVQNLVTADLTDLGQGVAVRTLMLNGDGDVLDDVVVARLPETGDPRHNGFVVIANPERAHTVLAWMRGHADGYLLFEPSDITAKIEGPVVVEDLAGSDPPVEEACGLIQLHGEKAETFAAEFGAGAPYAVLGGEKAVYLWPKKTELVATVDSLVRGGAELCTLSARKSLRQAAGLPQYPLTVAELIEKDGAKWFDLHKPYFVGQRLCVDAAPAPDLPEFNYKETPSKGLKRTTLYDRHRALTKKLVDFAGWEMPVWYTSTMEEHRTVREAAGLFDVSHMGVFDVRGENATAFLDLVITNYSRWVRDGESYYGYLLDINGDALDDVMVYRIRSDYYLMVVNASNEEKDWQWLNLVNEGKVLIDRDNPHRRVVRPAELRNLRDEKHGEERKLNIAFQGPKSRKVLLDLMTPEEGERLKRIKRTGVGEFTLAGLSVVISRTGYTGEAMGFEIFCHPDELPELWDKILEAGEPYGVKPAGLGARDSTRTEAGLPLYGHEIAGPYKMTPQAAGFPSYVKFHKPFFVGKQALLATEATRERECVRFRVPERGTKPLKPGDPIANSRGDYIGNVTSCAVDADGLQIGLGYVAIKAAKPGKIAVFPMPPENRRSTIGSPLELAEKSKTLLPVIAEIIDRFPPKPEPKDLVRTEAQIAIEMID